MTAKAPVHPWKKTCSSMGKIFLINYNSYLKWPDAVPMTKITSFGIFDRLRCTLSIHGIPYFIFSHNGSSRASQDLNTFCKLNEIKYLMNVRFKYLKLH